MVPGKPPVRVVADLPEKVRFRNIFSHEGIQNGLVLGLKHFQGEDDGSFGIVAAVRLCQEQKAPLKMRQAVKITIEKDGALIGCFQDAFKARNGRGRR